MTKPPWVTGRPLQVGDVVHGYAQGLFGRDHYACSRVEAIGKDWVAVRGVTTGKPAVSAGEDVVELLAEARDYGRATWCLDSEGCGEDPDADRAAREQDPIEAANPYTSTDLWRLTPGHLLLTQLRYAGVAGEGTLDSSPAIIRTAAEHHALNGGDLVRAANGELHRVSKSYRYDDFDKAGPAATWLERWSDEYAIILGDDGVAEDYGAENVFPLTVVDVAPRRPKYVYVLGWSPENDTIWGVYSSREAAEAARVALGQREGESGPVGWIEEVPLRTGGSVPERPVVG